MPLSTIDTSSISGLGYGFKNRIINGAMTIDQRNAGALVAGTTGAIYPVDRTLIGVFGSGTGRISGQRSTTAPSGFYNSLVATVTTADASPSTYYGYCIQQRIEGNNIADFGFGSADASTVTLSFWVRSSVTGTYSVSLMNDAITQAYTATYTVISANTWELKTITVSGSTSGTWEKTTSNGMTVSFGLGGGSGRVATTNSWNAPSGAYAPTTVSGQANWIGTNGATFYITGVQLEKGTVATSFDYRPYGTELALCQRYYQGPRKYIWIGYMVSGYVCGMYVPLTQEMRAVPTISVTSVYRDKFNAEVVNDVTTNAVRLQALSTGTGGEFLGSFTASAEL